MSKELQSLAAIDNYFGSQDNIGQNENDEFLLNLPDGNSTIGFRVVPPIGGTVIFEGSFNGITWEEISMRSIDNDLMSHSTDITSNFIGSISGLRKFRIRTSSAGSAAGTMTGKLQKAVAVLEGIEFGNPPHKFGFTPISKDGGWTSAQTGTTIWDPTTGNKFVLTDLILIIGGNTDGVVTIFDETNSTGNIIFKGTIDISNNRQFSFNHAFKVPKVSSAINNILKITMSTDMTVDVVVHGYEV